MKHAILIRHAHVFAPEDLGQRDVLMVNGRFLAVEPDLNVTLPEMEMIDAKGKILTPGFFDQHIRRCLGNGFYFPLN